MHGTFGRRKRMGVHECGRQKGEWGPCAQEWIELRKSVTLIFWLVWSTISSVTSLHTHFYMYVFMLSNLPKYLKKVQDRVLLSVCVHLEVSVLKSRGEREDMKPVTQKTMSALVFFFCCHPLQLIPHVCFCSRIVSEGTYGNACLYTCNISHHSPELVSILS